MLENIKQISLLDKVFNLQGAEWPKVGLSFLMRFLYRVGFVVGWTIIVGMFVSHYGISSLPYLFVVNALFSVIGSVFFSSFLHRFSRQTIMIVTLVLAVVTLLGATYFVNISQPIFFALLLVAEAVFIVQFRILLEGFIEDLFTPLSSERTFPIVESAVTMGGIVAGLILLGLSNFIEIYEFVYLWSALLIALIPIIFVYGFINPEIKILKAKKPRARSIDLFTKVRKEFSNHTQFSFVKGLILIVLFYWLLNNLVEFQYTKAIYQNVSNVVMDSGSGFEHSFVHELGGLFMVFSGVALLIQLFLGSRLISSLGIMGSMLLHPIVMVLSVIPMIFSFGFIPALIMKNNFTVTGVIHTNAYHSSYYAVSEGMRGYVREFLEGIVRPIGAMIGTLFLILMELVFDLSTVTLPVNLLLLFFVIVLFFVVYRQQGKYTAVAVQDLRSAKDRHERINAIDILAQRGHKSSLPVLREMIQNPKEDVSVRARILKVFGELEDLDSINLIVDCFESSSMELKMAAIDALFKYRIFSDPASHHLFARYELLESLKDLYQANVNRKIRSKIIVLLSHISSVSAIEFLLELLKRSRGALRADAIYALGMFKDESLVKFIEPYLESKNDRHRIAAAIALARLEDYEDQGMSVIYSFIHSKKNRKIALGLYALGELMQKDKVKICRRHINADNVEIRMYAAIAMAKMGYSDSIATIVNILISGDTKAANHLKELIKNIDVRISKNVDKIIRQMVSERIDALLEQTTEVYLDKLHQKKLKDLRWWYSLIDQHEEVELINKILKTQ